ncbi:branched-chain amino acid ABC transporter permease [Thermoanaerobacteraceae bacterium SP2]|nr:branched-chain amino acid ABC transporter permease [Thermoanaerobacteraceae bacterium SP2]
MTLETILQQIINGLVLGCNYTLIALGMTMIFGILNVLNFAHGEFYMIGAYIGFTIMNCLGLGFWYTFFLVIIFMVVFAYVVDLIFFRPFYELGHNNQMVSTIALSILLQNLALLIWTPNPRHFALDYTTKTISLGPITITVQRLLVIVVAALMVLILFYIIDKTSLGRAIRATSQDRMAAELTGVNVKNIGIYVITIGSVLAGIAGIMVAPLFLVYPSMGIEAVGKAFVVVILGGMGNIPGAILGGLLVGMIESFTIQYLGAFLKEIIVFLIMICILIIRPEGLYSSTVKTKV